MQEERLRIDVSMQEERMDRKFIFQDVVSCRPNVQFGAKTRNQSCRRTQLVSASLNLPPRYQGPNNERPRYRTFGKRSAMNSDPGKR